MDSTPLAWKLFFAAALLVGSGALATGVGVFVVLGPERIGLLARPLDPLIAGFGLTLALVPWGIIAFVMGATLLTAGIIAVGLLTMLRGSRAS